MKITAPLLAGKFDSDKAQYPYLATQKIDGIRFLIVDGVAVSRTFKPLRNKFIQKMLSENLYEGMDGEITSGTTFQESTSAVMTIEGEPTFKVWLFDYVNPTNPPCGYKARMDELERLESIQNIDYEVLYPEIMNSEEELMEFHRTNLEKGAEGTMVRTPNGAYKCGRSTVKENILLKVKDFTDDECIVVGLEELMSNQNEAEKDAFGRTKRSTHKDNQVPMNTLGAFVVTYNGKTFKIGSGLDDETRATIWNNQEEYIGRTMKFKYFECGVKELPRHPVFLGWRHQDDIGESSVINEEEELNSLEALLLS